MQQLNPISNLKECFSKLEEGKHLVCVTSTETFSFSLKKDYGIQVDAKSKDISKEDFQNIGRLQAMIRNEYIYEKKEV